MGCKCYSLGADGSWSLLEERGQLLGLWVPMQSPLIPVIFMIPDTAVLLFLAMPMLAVGGILFLITNLQV